MRLYTTLAAALLTFALAAPVDAQDKPFAVTLGYPTAAGVKWQALERLALRSEFTLGYSNELIADFDVRAGAWTFGIAECGGVDRQERAAPSVCGAVL